MPLNTESSVRSPTKRWSSILSQPSIFRKSSADHIHRYSTIESAGPTSPDVKRLFRTRRSVSAGDAVFDDPWEMRSASCCEFDRLRNNLGLDDADSLDNIFQRFFEINFTTDSLDERDTSSDSETLSSSEPHSSDSDLFLAAEAGQAPAAAIHSVDLASRVLPSPSIISSIPPPKPARSSRRPAANRVSTTLTPLTEHPSLEQSESYHTSYGRDSPADSENRIDTPPLDPSQSVLSYLLSNHSGSVEYHGSSLTPTHSLKGEIGHGMSRSSTMSSLPTSSPLGWSTLGPPALPYSGVSSAENSPLSRKEQLLPPPVDYLQEVTKSTTYSPDVVPGLKDSPYHPAVMIAPIGKPPRHSGLPMFSTNAY